MCGAVVVDLIVLPDTGRKEAIERGDHICAKSRISVLVDDDGGSGVADEDGTDAFVTSGRATTSATSRVMSTTSWL
jgi:hypothetical protein